MIMLLLNLTKHRLSTQFVTWSVNFLQISTSAPIVWNSLRKSHSRWIKKSSENASNTSSHVNIRFLSTPEKKNRILERATKSEKQTNALPRKNLQTHRDTWWACEQFTARWFTYFDEWIFTRNLQVISWRKYCKTILGRANKSSKFEKLKADAMASLNIIRWCLNLKLMSSSSYHGMRTAGFIKLPSERTLRDYSNYFKSKTGYQVEVIRELQQELKVLTLPESKKW